MLREISQADLVVLPVRIVRNDIMPLLLKLFPANIQTLRFAGIETEFDPIVDAFPLRVFLQYPQLFRNRTNRLVVAPALPTGLDAFPVQIDSAVLGGQV